MAKRYSAKFKFQIALEAAKGTRTLNELTSEYSVHPNQISAWKRELLESGASLFSSKSARQQREHMILLRWTGAIWTPLPEVYSRPVVNSSAAAQAATNDAAAPTIMTTWSKLWKSVRVGGRLHAVLGGC